MSKIVNFIKHHIHRLLQNFRLISQKPQAQKTGKSAPGGYVLGPTRYENTARVRLVGRTGSQFRMGSQFGTSRLPFSFGSLLFSNKW